MPTVDAFQTWEARNESLERVEDRIHDGVPREQLIERGRRYVGKIFELFPWYSIAQDKPPVEIGPGVGYIMQAFSERLDLKKIIGLDVAAGMISHAKERVRRDGLPAERFEFTLYDGVNFPFQAEEIGAFYSVAAIQHVPKPYAYNIIFEINRCLAPGGCCAIHLLSWDHLPYSAVSLQEEVKNQIAGHQGHWHHYWDRNELEAIMRYGLGTSQYEIKDDIGQIWLAWKK